MFFLACMYIKFILNKKITIIILYNFLYFPFFYKFLIFYLSIQKKKHKFKFKLIIHLYINIKIKNIKKYLYIFNSCNL